MNTARQIRKMKEMVAKIKSAEYTGATVKDVQTLCRMVEDLDDKIVEDTDALDDADTPALLRNQAD